MGQTIKNADVPLLESVVNLMQDVRVYEERARFERETLENITQHFSMTGGHGGAGRTFDDTFARIAEIQEKHRQKARAYSKLVSKVDNIVNGIEDDRMQTFVMLTYIEKAPKAQVCEEMNMSEWEYRMSREAIEKAPCMAEVKWRERLTGKKEEKC